MRVIYLKMFVREGGNGKAGNHGHTGIDNDNLSIAPRDNSLYYIDWNQY